MISSFRKWFADFGKLKYDFTISECKTPNCLSESTAGFCRAMMKMARRLVCRPVSTAEVQVQVKVAVCPDAWAYAIPFQLAHRLHRPIPVT